MPNPLGISKSLPNLFTSTIGKTNTQDISSKLSKSISSVDLEKFAKKTLVDLADKAMDSMLEDLIDSTPSSDYNINVPAPKEFVEQSRTVTLQNIMRDVHQLSTASGSERKVLLSRLGESFLKLKLDTSDSKDLAFLNDILKHPSIQSLSNNDRLGLAIALIKVGIAHPDVLEGLTTDKYEQETLETASTLERIFEIIEDVETLKGEIEAIIDLYSDGYDESSMDDSEELQRYRGDIPSTLLEQLHEAAGKPDDALIEKIIDAILAGIADSSVRDKLADLFMNYILEYRSDDIREMEQMQDTLDGKSDSVSLKSKIAPTPTIKSGSDEGKGSTSIG